MEYHFEWCETGYAVIPHLLGIFKLSVAGHTPEIYIGRCQKWGKISPYRLTLRRKVSFRLQGRNYPEAIILEESTYLVILNLQFRVGRVLPVERFTVENVLHYNTAPL